MKRTAAVCAVLFLLAGCAARRPHASSGFSAVHETMARQVANAWDAGEGDLELRRWRVSVAENASDVDARLNLARAYRSAGAPELALEHLRQVRAARPADEELVLEEARLWDSLGLAEKGLTVVEAFAATYPVSTPLHLWIGLAYDRLGEWKKGEPSHRAALAADPHSAVAHNNLGYNLLSQGRMDESLPHLVEAVRLAPGNPVARNNLALAYARRGDSEPAFRLWRETQGSTAAHNNLAAVEMEKGRHTQAREQLTAALTRDRGYAPALRNLQTVAEHDGGPATVPVARNRAPWVHWASGLKKILIGTDESGSRPAGLPGAARPAR